MAAETVYQKESVYTYVFTITNEKTPKIDFANTFTSAGSSGYGDTFNCGNGSCLNYGVIGSSSVDDTGFSFDRSAFRSDFNRCTKAIR
jgi:hypothetical protein